MTKQEKAAMKKLLAEGLLLFILGMLLGSWMFDYDPEEETRFDNIKQRILHPIAKINGIAKPYLSLITIISTYKMPEIIFVIIAFIPSNITHFSKM